MAEPGVIAAYLTELRFSLDKLPATEVDAILDEAADHLSSAREAALASGADETSVDAEVLARFGSAALVAKVFAEEAKRGSAISTSVTRRAGMAAVASVGLLAVGQAGNHLTSRGLVHGAFLAILTAGLGALVFGLYGLRRRHGGLGGAGRVAFWSFLASPFVAAPALYAAPLVLAAEWLLIMTLLGVGMLRARVLPRAAVLLFTMSPVGAVAIALALTAASLDAGPWFLTLLSPVAIGYAWLGWAMAQEPALDTRAGRSTIPPLTTA